MVANSKDNKGTKEPAVVVGVVVVVIQAGRGETGEMVDLPVQGTTVHTRNSPPWLVVVAPPRDEPHATSPLPSKALRGHGHGSHEVRFTREHDQNVFECSIPISNAYWPCLDEK